MIKNTPEVTAQITLGTVPGYDADNSKAVGYEDFCKYLQKFEESNFNKEGEIPISWLVFPAKTVYPKSWGAPIGGEDVYVLQASYVSKYESKNDMTNWMYHVKKHAEELKKYFSQSTVRLQFTECGTLII